MPEPQEDETRRLFAEIDGPAEPSRLPVELPPSQEDVAAEPGPMPGAPGPGRRRAVAGGVMAVSGAAWLGVGAATFATPPCVLGGVFLALGIWVVLGSKFQVLGSR